MVPQTTIDMVKNADAEMIISRVGVKYAKRYGKYLRFPCPFHGSQDDDFLVDTEHGWYKCKSAKCSMSKGSDAIGFVMRLQGCDFKTAISIISGTSIVEFEKVKVWQASETSVEKMERLSKRYREASGQGAKWLSKKYWMERGLDEKTISDFHLGAYSAPANPDMGFSGTLKHTRHLIPWFTNGRLVCGTARRDDFECNQNISKMAPEWLEIKCGGREPLKTLYGPKFLTLGGRNSNRIFNNRRLINVVNGDVQFWQRPTIFIAEGPGDVMALECAGFPAVEGRESTLMKDAVSRVEKIYIIADNDEAGLIYAQQMKDRIGRDDESVRILVPTLKDPLEMLKAGTLKEWLKDVI